MHLPPEVERLVPGLLARVAEPGAVEAGEEAERIETLLLAGDPDLWLQYLRERGRLIEGRARAGGEDAADDLAPLAGIFRDQLALIQVAIDLGPDDLALLDSLQRLERGAG